MVVITYKQVTADTWSSAKASILDLVRKHHDKHITRKAYNHVKQLKSVSLNSPGVAIWTAWSGSQLVGALISERYGVRTSMMVVHRDFRSQGIAKELLKQATCSMGRFYGEVAADNLASLKACFGMGLVAYDVFLRRGKPTLRVRNGFAVERVDSQRQS